MAVAVFIQLSIIVIAAVVISAIMKLLKQPLIIGYIITGIIMGPNILNMADTSDSIPAFAQIGVALLLFMVGLNLNPKIIKDIGRTSLILGTAQILLTSAIGFFIIRAFGFSSITSLYISVALAFSSTIIVMKLLADKKDTETLYGGISVGLLIVQDLVAIILLLIVSSMTSEANLRVFAVETLVKGAGLFLFVLIAGIYLMPKLTKRVAESQEFLFLFSIGWAFALSALFYYLNFSMEIGALLAGVTLSMSAYRYEISSKMKPLRDFFIIMFFILLGSQAMLTNISAYILPIIVLSLFVLVLKPIIVIIIMGMLGYTKRNSFLTGLTMTQISEFSLILIALGIKVGHASDEILSLVTIIGIITIAVSSYLILYGNKIYERLSKYLEVFERKGRKIDEHKYQKNADYDIFLFGYNRIGYDLVESFKKMRKKFLIVDYNPETIQNLVREGIECRYGDAGDYELLNELNFTKAKMIISTIPDRETNLLLINKIKEINKKTIIIVVSHQIDEAIDLYEAGATYVVMPHFLGGHHTSAMIEEFGMNTRRFLKEKLTHIAHLKKRKHLGHEHPKTEF